MMDLARVVATLATRGLDVAHACDGARARAVAPRLAHFDRPRPQALLVGNSRALWPRFLAAVDAGDVELAAPHPLDGYVERAVAAALDEVPVAAQIAWGHVADPDHGFWPLSRIAEAVGLGRLAPSHLLIHPEFGPWLGLRALVVFDAELVREDPAGSPPPCDCARACEVAFVHAQQARGEDAWRAWVAVRDACPVGAAARYDEAQLQFHYTGGLLRRRREAGPVRAIDE